MLNLTRKPGETIWIGEDICIRVMSSTSGRIGLAIDAPKELKILRGELRRATAGTESDPEERE